LLIFLQMVSWTQRTQPALSHVQCRRVIYHCIKYFFKSQFDQQEEFTICDLEMAFFIAKMANHVHLFRISAESGVSSSSDSTHIAWLPFVSEMKFPPIMEVDFQSKPTDIFFISCLSISWSSPPSHMDSYIRDGRFFLEGINQASATAGKPSPDDKKQASREAHVIPSSESLAVSAKRRGEARCFRHWRKAFPYFQEATIQYQSKQVL